MVDEKAGGRQTHQPMTAVRIYFLLSAMLFVAFGAACANRPSPARKSPARERIIASADRSARHQEFPCQPDGPPGPADHRRGDNAVPLSKEVLSITNLFIKLNATAAPT
jgi:hypothetical protein